MYRSNAHVRQATTWPWLAPWVILSGLALLILTPGLLVHWQGAGTVENQPRPLARLDQIRPAAATARALATIEPAVGGADRQPSRP